MIKKYLDMMEGPLLKFSIKISENRLLEAIKDAFIFALPFTVIGSFSSLIKMQLDYFQIFESMTFIKKIAQILGNIGWASMAFIGIIIVLSSSYFYSEKLRRTNKQINPVTAMLAGLVSYIAVVPNVIVGLNGAKDISGFQNKFFNYEGMFSGLLIGLITAYLYDKLIKTKYTLKLPSSVPDGIVNSFMSLIPITIILAIFSTVKIVIESFGFDSLHTLITKLIVYPLSNVGTGLPAIVLITIVMQLLWFFGLHGFSIIWGVISPVWIPIFLQQIDIFSQTQSFDSLTRIAPNALLTIYGMIGGSGSTLGLVAALFILAPKNSAEKAVADVSVIPGLFNINEPIIFGLPIVLNPVMFIPFMFIPLLNIIIAYFAISTRSVVPAVVMNAGIEPVFINAWLTGAFRVSPLILMVGLFLLDTLLYFPFVKTVLKLNRNEN
ncbi:MAG: PTS sugar transporter subunit IIC [Cetobacterium sp.]